MDIPDSFGNMRIRRAEDGTYVLARKHRVAEAFLDEHCVRLLGELAWEPRTQEGKPWSDLQNRIRGKHVYIIGKGESLDCFNSSHIDSPDSPIICLNQSIHYIDKLNLPNPIFVIPWDGVLWDSCMPKNGDIIVGYTAKNWFASIKDKYIFYPSSHGLPKAAYTVVFAITIAKVAKASKITMVAFDSYVNKNYKYAPSLNLKYKKDPKSRLEAQRPHIDSIKQGIEFLTPESLVAIVSDKLQPLPDSPEEHRALDPGLL